MSKNIGGLWKPKKKAENGPVMNGSIEIVPGIRTHIAVFVNNRKQSDKSPDYTIVANHSEILPPPASKTRPVQGHDSPEDF